MTGFDDLVAHAKQRRDRVRAADEFQRDRAQKETGRAVAEVSEIGRKAAEHLRDGQVPAIPIIEFGTGLLGRAKIVETGRAWQLSAGLLAADGTFLDNPVVVTRDAANDGSPDGARRRLHALKKAGFAGHDDVVIGPAKPSVRIGEHTALHTPVAYLWSRTLEYLPINDHALSMTGGGRDEYSVAVAELIARDVAALLSARS